MKKMLGIFILFIFIWANGNAQMNRYIVKFKDKGNNNFSFNNPIQFLSQRSINRRVRYNIPIDSLDLPVSVNYLEAIRVIPNITVLNVSRWLNQVSIFTTDPNAITSIQTLPFVISASPIASRSALTPRIKHSNSNPITVGIEERIPKDASNDAFNYGFSFNQIKIHKGDFLHNHGFRGQGMQMAVIDAGFYHYNTLPTFDSVRLNNQILATWDFVDNKVDVTQEDSHGMHCLSTIAADLPGVFVGSAPKTSFYLFRSEDVSSEYPIEEHNFAVATERADSLGVDICSTSLGYTTFDDPTFDYSYSDMNGNTTMSARATDIAAKKGMLMVTAAGNEGNGAWHYISTPADADSAFTIGAVDTLGQIANFSSFGPSSDGQIKPSVASVGRNTVIANNNTGLPTYGSGTSYACPNMAGITTCLWQAFPEANNMEIIDVLQRSANNFNTPNDRIGYGIPNSKKAFVMLQKKYATDHASISDCKTFIDLSIKTDTSMKIIIERKYPVDNNYAAIATLQSNAIFGTHQFSYTDDLNGTNYNNVSYRYKMIIGTDTSYYIDSVVINYPNSCIGNTPVSNNLSVSPNPVSNFVNVKLQRIKETSVEISIANSIGQIIYQTSFNQSIGNGIKSIDMSKYSRGVYFISIYLDGKKELIQKIIK